MRGGLGLLTIAVLASSCGTPKSNVPRTRMTPKDIVQQSTDAIVRIEATDTGVGTGFILDKSGLVATNLHVIAGSANIKVKLHDGTEYMVHHIAGVDPGRDLALLRIKPQKPLKTVRLGDSDQMTAGDTIIAIGNPLGVFDYTVSSGLISQVRPVCTEAESRCPPGGLTLLQISAPISKGSSGGPLFNHFGEVVGVTTLIVEENHAQAINFAVPANYLKPLIAQPTAIPMEKFAEATTFKSTDEPTGGGSIDRKVPEHDIEVLKGCSDKDVYDVVQAVAAAIDVGAPLYNRGDIEACFRIYEGTSTKLERDPPCPGVGKAFGDGLLRAAALPSFKEKAWALRDTFDGMIEVAKKRGVRPGQAP